MTDPGLQLEAWTLPNSGTFTRKFDLTRWVRSYTLSDRWSGLSDGTLSLPDEFTRLEELFTVDEANHANDVGSVVRILRAGLPVGHYVVTRTDDSFSDSAPLVNVGLAGMEWFLDRARVHAYDYPADPSTESDWLYGANSVLTTIGGETANELQEIWRGSNVTSGTIKISDGLDVTADLAYNMTASDLQTALELFAGINQVSVRGDGSLKTPYEIEYQDPISAPELYIHTNNTDGDWSVSTTREGGSLSERPWIKSTHPVTGQEHGNYQTFQISTAFLPVGDTYALQVDPDDVDYPTDYAGAQQYVQVTPGHRYRASIPVYAPTTARTFRLVIRDMSEQFIASSGDILVSPDTWTTLSTGIFTMPADIHQVIFRVGIIETTNISSVYIGIESAVLAPGAAAAPLGSILNDLLVPINGRGVLTWLIPTWTASLDSAGAAWDRSLAWHIKRGQSILQLLEYAGKWGYEWRIRWDDAQTRFELDVFNPAGGGTNLSTSVTVSGRDGGTGSGPIVRRIPDLTHALAEGDLGRWGEYSAATLAGPWGRLEGYFGNKTGADSTGLASLAQALTDKATTDTSGRRLQLMDPSKLPWTDYQPGDTVTVNLQPKDTKQALRVMQVTVTGGNAATPVYDVHAASIVLDPESALVDTVRSLARQFRGLEDVPENDRTLDPATYGGGSGTVLPWLVASAYAPSSVKAVAGFVCDGLADQVEIQACIDAVADGADDGMTVVLSDNDFFIDEPASGPAITLKWGVNLVGQNQEATRLVYNSTTGGSTALIEAKGNNTIANIQSVWDGVDSPSILVPASGGGLRLLDCTLNAGDAPVVDIGNSATFIWIERCYLDSASNLGDPCVLTGTGVQELWITRSVFKDGGITVTGGRIWITDNWVNSTNQNGIVVNAVAAGGGFFYIDRNILQSVGGGLGGPWGAIKVLGPTTGSEPIVPPGTEEYRGWITNNLIESTSQQSYGIWVNDAEAVLVAGNYLEETSGHGIYLQDVDLARVVDNLVAFCGRGGDNTYDGINLDSDTNRCYVSGNTIRTKVTTPRHRYGVRINSADCDDNIVVGNDLRGAGATADYSDAGTGTINRWPASATAGDNFVGSGPYDGSGLPSTSIGTVTVSLPTPKISTHGATPAPVTVAIGVPQASRGQSNTRTPAPVTVTITLPQAATTAGAQRTPSPVTVAVTIPRPTV